MDSQGEEVELDAEFDCFLADIDAIEESNKPEPIPVEPSPPPWRECVDESTQHPYYWHTDTGEVTWVMPASFQQDTVNYDKAMATWKSKCEEIHSKIKLMDEKEQQLKKPFPPVKPSPPSIFGKNGPIKEFKKPAENLKYEVGQGIGKFRFQKPEPGPPQDLPPANSKRLTFKVAGTKSEEEVEKERMELDGEPDLPHPSEVTSPVKTIPLPSLTNGSNEKRSKEEIAAEIRKKKQQIALTNTRLLLQKRVQEAKQRKLEGNKEESKPPVKEKKKEKKKEEPKIQVEEPVSRKRRIFQEVKVEPVKKEVDKELKRAVEKESSLMKDKLEFLGGDRACLSKFQVQLIALETRLQDWEAGHLCGDYMQAKVSELAQMLRTHEENSVQKEWTCTWDKDQKRYKYTNKLTSHCQLTHPGEESSSSDSGSETEEEPEKDNDDLYEQFQAEIDLLGDEKEAPSSQKDKKRAPSPPSPSPVKKPCPPPASLHPSNLPPSCAPPFSPPAKPPTPQPPPACPTPPMPYEEEHYMDPWAQYGMAGMMMSGFPALPPGGMIPAVPPPPPEIDCDTYSPGNTDDEDTPAKDKGVVSVAAPLRYDTPPKEISSQPVTYSSESKAPEEKKEKSASPVKVVKKVVLKKKKKTDILALNSSSSSGRKNRNMTSLVAKWNMANKHADQAITKTKK